jgi:hypothetical protein
MAASATRSSTPSSNAPRGPPRSCNRATSPSTPSATEAAWTSSAPARPRPAPSSAAPPRPSTNATSDTRSGAGRSGASAIDSRLDRGRLSRRLTGPSMSLPSERRSAALAARTSVGVSTSCHQHPAGRATARSGRARARRVTAPANVWSPSAATCRWQPNTSGGSRKAPQSMAGSSRCLPNATAAPSTTCTLQPSCQAARSGAGSTSTAGSPAASSRSKAPSAKTWSTVTSANSASPATAPSTAASDAPLPSRQRSA